MSRILGACQCLIKKALTPDRKRGLIADLMARFGASQRKICSLIGLSRSSWHYQSIARDSSALQMRIKEITETRRHYGYRRVNVMLKREGWKDNHKRVYRLYQEMGLSLRLKRPRRHKSCQERLPKYVLNTRIECGVWTL